MLHVAESLDSDCGAKLGALGGAQEDAMKSLHVHSGSAILLKTDVLLAASRQKWGCFIGRGSVPFLTELE